MSDGPFAELQRIAREWKCPHGCGGYADLRSDHALGFYVVHSHDRSCDLHDDNIPAEDVDLEEWWRKRGQA